MQMKKWGSVQPAMDRWGSLCKRFLFYLSQVPKHSGWPGSNEIALHLWLCVYRAPWSQQGLGDEKPGGSQPSRRPWAAGMEYGRHCEGRGNTEVVWAPAQQTFRIVPGLAPQ